MIETNYNSYIESIVKNLILNENEWYFKSDPSYKNVLEHVDKSTGDRYLNEIMIRYNKLFVENKEFLIELCNENDKYGKTIKQEFSNFVFCFLSVVPFFLAIFMYLCL